MTLALAIWGAATGTIAAAVEVAKYLLDRPRLIVGFHTNRSVGSPPELGIDVTNRGRRPTTILTAAYTPESEAEIRSPTGGAVVGTGTIDLVLSDQPTVIAANGGVAQFRGSLVKWPRLFHADEPLRPYVIDSHTNRPTWGPAAPILRMFLNGGWKPPDASPEHVAPADGPLRPKAIEPRWKIWKPKEFRKPSLPPPYAWPPPKKDAETTAAGE